MDLRNLLQANPFAKVAEIILVFVLGYAVIFLFRPLAGGQPALQQLVVWVANVLMLLLVWAGMRLRGERWRDFGLRFRFAGWKDALRTVGLSLLVFVLAMLGFALGSVVMVNITGVPQSADMSGYSYFQGRLWLLLLTLAGVYVVSSFGEEVIYRAFLINRISALGPGNRLGRSIAVVLSAVIFGFAHYEWGAMGIAQTIGMGLVLGAAYLLLKKRLLVLILAHAYMDTILMVQLYLGGG